MVIAWVVCSSAKVPKTTSSIYCTVQEPIQWRFLILSLYFSDHHPTVSSLTSSIPFFLFCYCSYHGQHSTLKLRRRRTNFSITSRILNRYPKHNQIRQRLLSWRILAQIVQKLTNKILINFLSRVIAIMGEIV